MIADLLVELAQPGAILARNDGRRRAQEGLPLQVEALHGDVPPTVEVREGDVRLVVDPWRDDPRALALDLRETRASTLPLAGRRALDCFAGAGLFALHLGTRCREVLTLAETETHASQLVGRAGLNGLETVHVKEGDPLEVLRELERVGERFDTVVVDPPSFARGRSDASRVLAAYREVNQRAFALLDVGGVLVTCSRTRHLDEGGFTELVAAAAHAARARALLLDKRVQSRDHPVLMSVPETSTLLGLVVRRVG